jgi:hypothetical protein
MAIRKIVVCILFFMLGASIYIFNKLSSAACSTLGLRRWRLNNTTPRPRVIKKRRSKKKHKKVNFKVNKRAISSSSVLSIVA